MEKKKKINNIFVAILFVLIAFILYLVCDETKIKYYIPLALIVFAVLIIIEVVVENINAEKEKKNAESMRMVYETLKSDYDNNSLVSKLTQGYFYEIEANLAYDEELNITFKGESYQINVAFAYNYSYISFNVSAELEEKLKNYSLLESDVCDLDDSTRKITIGIDNIYADILKEVSKEAKKYDEISKIIKK